LAAFCLAESLVAAVHRVPSLTDLEDPAVMTATTRFVGQVARCGVGICRPMHTPPFKSQDEFSEIANFTTCVGPMRRTGFQGCVSSNRSFICCPLIFARENTKYQSR